MDYQIADLWPNRPTDSMAHEGRDERRVPPRELRPSVCHTAHAADNVEREALTAMRSVSFDRPERGRIALKVVTATGMEMIVISNFGTPEE